MRVRARLHRAGGVRRWPGSGLRHDLWAALRWIDRPRSRDGAAIPDKVSGHSADHVVVAVRPGEENAGGRRNPPVYPAPGVDVRPVHCAGRPLPTGPEHHRWRRQKERALPACNLVDNPSHCRSSSERRGGVHLRRWPSIRPARGQVRVPASPGVSRVLRHRHVLSAQLHRLRRGAHLLCRGRADEAKSQGGSPDRRTSGGSRGVPVGVWRVCNPRLALLRDADSKDWQQDLRDAS
mmetsp:Transcript_10365/g.31703  ORF Transcript_10365/g.31703 Transcript_10365/m.31703 type:complete len:236 (+) Transcript_10365:164-871(+)